MEKLIVCFIIISCLGCSTNKPICKVEYKEVLIPTPVLPKKPPVYDEIDLPIYYLSEKDKANKDKIVEAYFSSVVILLGEVKKRDADLDVYRNFELTEEK